MSLFGTAIGFGKQSGSAAHAQLALAGAHSHTRAAAQVEHVVHIQVADGIVHFAHRNLFAFTHQSIIVDVVAVNLSAERAVAAFRSPCCHRFAHVVDFSL